MNKEYKIKLDLNKKLYNKKMAFNQFDENVNDFYIEVTKNNEVVKDLDKSIITLVAIKPNNAVDAQFIEVKEGQIYADLKPSMCDLVGNYQAKAMIVLEGEIVTTDTINYSVSEDKIISKLNDDVVSDERFPLFTDALARLSTIEISEEQRVINEAERILSEENRKIEEAKRVEAELIRQHEEADRAKYDATRESNENIRKQNESIRLANETNRIDEEAKRVEEETKRVEAEQLRKDNYNFMTEDEERRRSEANAHKEAEVLRVQAETNRVNEEAKRRTLEQVRVSAENTRVSNENTRKSNEIFRENNEIQRIEAETQRQSRYNSFIADAEANANNFENYTNTAKVKEEERKANELYRKSQEARRVSNEVERISNENTRKANEVARQENETSRQNVFENKVSEVDKKISEINITKDNFISSVNTKVDNKISEIEVAKSDMTTTVSNKIDEVENRFNALTASQQQDAEVIDARDGETSLKARLDRDIEKANKELDKIKKLEESTVSTVTTESDFATVEATSNGYFEDVKLEGKTLVNCLKLNGDWFDAETTLETSSTTTVGLSTYSKGCDLSLLKNNTTYTIIPFVDYTVVTQGELYLQLNTKVNGVENHLFRVYENMFNKPTLITTKELTNKNSKILFIGGRNCSYKVRSVKILILEGDHTQNPPSYFEGLKSVGQDVDEIVVSSVKGDGNLFDASQHIPNGWSNGNMLTNSNFRSYWIKCKPNTTYFVESDRSGNRFGVCCSNIIKFGGEEFPVTKGAVFGSSDDTDKIVSTLFTTDSTAKYLFVYTVNNGVFPTPKIMISKSDTQINYIEPNRDKKRLLFYNNETQTWEKPILREWDSIEKHSDGKYYYHQRSGEVVLNGTHSTSTYGNESDTHITFNTHIPNSNGVANGNLICEKFKCASVLINNDCVWMLTPNNFYIRLNKSLLPTQDVAGFKQWLQANNVTVVYQLAQEKVYECTNIDLITYANETNYIIESGAIVPKSILKVHNNISNVVKILQEKVSLLESNIKASQEVQDMMILETDMRMLDIELALMEFIPMKLNLGGSDMLRSATYFNFLKNHIINETYEKEYLENVMNKYLATGRINQDEYDELYKMLYPPVYDIELPIEY